MRKITFFQILYLTVTSVSGFKDPGKDLMKCVDGGEDLNDCGRQTLENIRDVMETGIPQLQLPPLDPIYLKSIGFKFYNLTVEFLEVDLFGFKGFSLSSSKINKKSRTWDIKLSLPKINAVGKYRLFGTIPPGLDLDTSTGDERLIFFHSQAG